MNCASVAVNTVFPLTADRSESAHAAWGFLFWTHPKLVEISVVSDRK